MTDRALEAAADTLSEALRERSLTEIRRLPDGDYWVEARLGTVYEAILDSLLGDLPGEAGLALYELSRGQMWPGVIDGMEVTHVGTATVVKTVLRSLRGGLGGGA